MNFTLVPTLKWYFLESPPFISKTYAALIGGLIIKVGSTMIDTSIKNKLQQLEKKMIEA